MKFISFKHHKEAKFGILNNQIITDLTNKINGANTLKDLIANNGIPEAKKQAALGGDPAVHQEIEVLEKKLAELEKEHPEFLEKMDEFIPQ